MGYSRVVAGPDTEKWRRSDEWILYRTKIRLVIDLFAFVSGHSRYADVLF